MDNASSRIGNGSRVTLHFRISIEDGTVMDETDPDDPMQMVIGDGSLSAALETTIMDMAAGESQCVTIPPMEGFGMPDETLVQTMDRSEFPADMPLEEGLMVAFSTPAGEQIPGVVRHLGEQEVVVDFNHPLSGHTITFEAEILAVDPASVH